MRVSITGIRTRVALLASVMVLGASVANAQMNLKKWKPNVGDKFICAVSHYSTCGDWGCDGQDTVAFEIIDTSYHSDTQHPDAVFATTTALGLHYSYIVWGKGYDTTEIEHKYSDTTLLSLTAPQQIATTFSGTCGFVGHDYWSYTHFDQDTSLMFQGQNYLASYSTTSPSSRAIFLPTIGWFLSLGGYGGYCTSVCTKEDWRMSLIAAIKSHGSVQTHSSSNEQLISSGGLLMLTATDASAISLSDILGNSIHFWQLPIESGPREITLNIADVPCGVYFLRVSAAGMEEVRKVVIAH